MDPHRDQFVSAVADDLSFRVVAARTTDTVRKAVEAQGADADSARKLAQLITGAVLIRVTMAPQLRVQGILRGAGKAGQIVADAHPDGWCRGLVKLPQDRPTLELGEGSVLQMMRSLPTGNLQQGMVEVPREGGIAAALMAYMQHSEQVVSALDVACVMHDGRVRASGGYMVQLLPEVPEGSLMVMTARLEHDFHDLDAVLTSTGASAEGLLGELLYGISHRIVEQAPLRFDCNCSQVRVMGSLATIARNDIEEMVEDAEPLHITCDYCNTRYTVEPEQLRGLLESS
jgi:molecular chaperone Hsp33